MLQPVCLGLIVKASVTNTGSFQNETYPAEPLDEITRHGGSLLYLDEVSLDSAPPVMTLYLPGSRLLAGIISPLLN